MNRSPHSHRLEIRDHGSFWGISYGDQTIVPTKIFSRWFGLISEQKALAAECRKVIRRHDRASRAEVATAVLAELQPKQPDAWGSDQ